MTSQRSLFLVRKMIIIANDFANKNCYVPKSPFAYFPPQFINLLAQFANGFMMHYLGTFPL